jgi:hypothetical protein
MLGRDMTASDDFHFKNWSYVFMKEFEAKNYDKLYVSIQPGVLTLYSNIIGFKSLYFLKDKLGLIPQTGKDFELLLNTFHKLPKVLTSLGIILFIYRKLSKITKPKFAFLVVVLLALEPLILGHARVIQTDALPMFIALLTLLILYDHRLKKPSMYAIVYIGVLSALCVLEKSLYFTLFIVLVAEITTNIFSSAKKWHHVQELVLYVCTFFITLVLLFPAFWGNFSFTLYRLTIGSFIFGVQGLDTEAFTYAKTQHLHDFFYYFRFLLNKVSAEIWVGLLLFTLNIKTLRKSFNKHQLTFLAFPLLSFSVLLIAEKKLGRYTILIFPYLILLASLGYYKLVEKRFIIIIVLFISVKLAQLGFLFPDFLMYKNPLSFDQGFNNTAEAWGSGGKKLGDYLTKTYGVNKVLYTADYRFLYLYYAGEVLSKDALTCASVYDFIITTSPAQTVCNKKLKVIDTYAAHKDLKFYILK